MADTEHDAEREAEHDSEHDASRDPVHLDHEVVSTPPGPPLRRDSPFFRGFFWTFGALAALLLAFAVREAAAMLTLVLIAGFLAVGLEPVVGYVGRRGVKRGWAVLGIGVGLVVVVGGIAYVLGTTLSSQIADLVDNAPQLLQDLRNNATVRTLDNRFDVISKLETALDDRDLATNLAGGALDLGLGVANFLVNTVIVYILMLYFLAARPQITRALYSLAPESRRERVGALGEEILHRVGRYAIGAVFVALIAGTVTAIFCVSAGLGEYALPLAVLVALFDLVPLVGAILGAASVCLVGLTMSTTTFFVCVGFYLVYEILEGYVIYPRVMRSSVDVPEYVTIMAVLIGGAIAGIVGALLALPVAAALLLLVREVWVRRQDTS